MSYAFFLNRGATDRAGLLGQRSAPATVTPTRLAPSGSAVPVSLVRRLGRVLFGLVLTVAAWQAFVVLARPEPWILPGPLRVGRALLEHHAYLAANAAITAGEIVLGLLIGGIAGSATALALAAAAPLRRALMPLLVASQALPVFAIAPLLVTWFGYGLGSKIAMASLIIYFPIASAFLDGLTRTDPGLLDVARLAGARRWDTLRLVRLPAAVPALVSGLRVAASVAPIGAIVGEWVGSAGGLGYVMLQANARVQTDLLFAALALLCLIAVALRAMVDALATRVAARWLAL